MNSSKSGKVDKKYLKSKQFKDISRVIVLIYLLLAGVYVFRDNLYRLNNPYITRLTETAPNLMGSILFNLIAIFYVVAYFRAIDSINKPILIWLVNLLNIVFFLLIEYVHVVLDLGSWDNNDIVASLIGMAFSTAIYFKLRKET